MSTYWYFECLSHDPPLRMGEEFSQHTDDFHFRLGVAIAHSRPISSEWWENRCDYFTANTYRALLGHDTCTLGIVNEYGYRQPLPEPHAEAPQ